MLYPNPSYVDGLHGLSDLQVYCLNNLATYTTYDGDPGEEGTTKEYTDANEEPLGSDTRVGFAKGSINLQYDETYDELPAATKLMRPAFVVLFRNRYYVVGAVKPKIVKNDVIKFSIGVTELQNPAIPILLTTRGQQKKAAIAASTPVTVACAAVNTRPGATLAYSVEDYAIQGGGAPAGVSIVSGTGVMTVNIAAGTTDIRVIVSDTLEGNVRRGWGRYTATAT